MKGAAMHVLAITWLAGMLALMWATAWVEHHWDRSPLTCTDAYFQGLTCGRPLSAILFGLGLVTLIAVTAALAVRISRH